MNPHRLFSNKAGLLICAVGLLALTGCVGSSHSHGGYAQAGYTPVDPVFVDQDDYVYYPGYEMYYGRRSNRYYYREGSAWVARPAPHQVEVNVLHTAPSVQIEFHDNPSRHHPDIVRRYPKNWKPVHRDQDDNRRDDRRDDRDRRN